MAPHCTFPYRLHAILEQIHDTDVDGEASIISWTPTGKSFKIHSIKAFEEVFLPKYFTCQSKYKSFRRQLQYYGFINHGRDHHFAHPFFLRKHPELLTQVQRKSKLTKRRDSGTSVVPQQCSEDYLLLPESPTREMARDSLTRLITSSTARPDVAHNPGARMGATAFLLRVPQPEATSSNALVDLLALHVLANSERRIACTRALSSPSPADCHSSLLLNQAIATRRGQQQQQQLALLNFALLTAPFSVESRSGNPS